MTRRARVTSTLMLALGLASPLAAQSAEQQLRLSIGDPARRDRDVRLVLDGITDTTSGDVITPADLAGRLKGTRLLLIGESHTSQESHRVQLRVIEHLFASGRPLMIGLEMFPYTEQRFLDQWRDGLLTEEGFVTLSRWYEHWGYHWRYYRDIFLFARDHRIPMVAVNTPRDVVAAVRKKGFANLSPDEAAHIPPSGVDVDSADHMAFFKSSFSEGDTLHGGMTDEAWKGMLSAQATWDATMGWNAIEALQKRGTPDTLMVILVGSGHVAYDVGIARQARRWFDGQVATLIPVPVALPNEGKSIDSLRASYAGFVWGVMPEEESSFPSLGLSTRAGENGRRVVLQVEKDSAAARAGFAVNDVLMSMDGHPLPDRESLNMLMARKAWGDGARFVVKRGDREETLTVYFRRTPPRVAAPTPPSAAAPAPGKAPRKAQAAPKPSASE